MTDQAMTLLGFSPGERCDVQHSSRASPRPSWLTPIAPRKIAKPKPSLPSGPLCAPLDGRCVHLDLSRISFRLRHPC
jgi:hypothetical protein